MKKSLLLTPGPCEIPPAVLAAMAKPAMHHRTPQFNAIFREVIEGLKYVYQTGYDVLLFASSGTGAMVSSVTNLLSPGDEAIVARAGKFGERWEEICTRYGVKVHTVEAPYGKTVTPDRIEKAAAEHPNAKAVYVTHSETSTATRMDIEAIGRIFQNKPQVLVVDSITGLGALPVHPEQWGLDVVVGGSQKAFMLPPGLAFASVSPKAWELSKGSKIADYYFDWKAEKKNHDDDTTHFTTPVSLILAMQASIQLIREEGIENIWKRTRAMAEATRAAAKALGLRLFSEAPSDSVTAFLGPDGIGAEDIRKKLNKDFGINVAGGQGTMKGQIFRASHMGYVSYTDTLQFIGAMEIILSQLGRPEVLGKGIAAAEKVFAA